MMFLRVYHCLSEHIDLKLVYDFVSGFHQENGTDPRRFNGRLALFRNFDETTGNALPQPNTL